MVVIADTGRYGLTEESDQMYLGCANTSEFAGAPENVLWINQAEQDLRYDFDPKVITIAIREDSDDAARYPAQVRYMDVDKHGSENEYFRS